MAWLGQLVCFSLFVGLINSPALICLALYLVGRRVHDHNVYNQASKEHSLEGLSKIYPKGGNKS